MKQRPRRFICLLLLSAVLLLLLSGCGGGGNDDDDADVGAEATAEAARTLFAEKGCAECHGPDGEGDGQNPRTVIKDTRMIIQQFQQRVRNGRGSAMPAFTPEQISDEEIIQLHDWLKVQR
ncbi:MAG: hypothetical protein DCC58_11095 [Chloroflexi bacterium]|nr:MAG: hypothetical protein DCC58_11095 [Chloroflexota bacterium]